MYSRDNTQLSGKIFIINDKKTIDFVESKISTIQHHSIQQFTIFVRSNETQQITDKL